MKEYEKVWEEYWKPIVTNEDGTVNLDQVKRELADFKVMLKQVPRVYCHVTGDSTSNPLTSASKVIELADEYYKEFYTEIHKDDINEIIENEYLDKEEFIERIKEYFE